MDASSIGDQEQTKQLWEEQIASDQRHQEWDNNNTLPPHESAIEKEIRLQRERELELKRERESRGLIPTTPTPKAPTQSTMPIYKVPQPVRVHRGDTKTQPPVGKSNQMYKELTEVDRDSEMLKRESIIEREIREQQEREEALRHSAHVNKVLRLLSLSLHPYSAR